MRLDMVMPGKFAEISVETFVNATEDPDKVKHALTVLFGTEWEISTETVDGSFGNPIVLMRIRLHRKGDVDKVLRRMLGFEFISHSLDRVDDRLDDNMVYHVRLDKASSYLGEPRLWNGGEAIEIRIKVVTYPRSREEALTLLKSMADDSGKGKID
jgi:RNA binding exosome subunit